MCIYIWEKMKIWPPPPLVKKSSFWIVDFLIFGADPPPFGLFHFLGFFFNAPLMPLCTQLFRHFTLAFLFSWGCSGLNKNDQRKLSWWNSLDKYYTLCLPEDQFAFNQCCFQYVQCKKCTLHNYHTSALNKATNSIIQK